MVEPRQTVKLDKAVAKKLDSGLRRLIRMPEEDIVAQVNRANERLEKQRLQLMQKGSAAEKEASEEERQGILSAKRLALKKLLPDPVFGLVLAERWPQIPVRIRAIIHFTGNRDDLVALGLTVTSQIHDVFTVTGTTAQLADLAAQPAALRVQLPRLLVPNVNVAAAQADIYPVHVPGCFPEGYQGEGVVVGIIDTALDVTHWGFRDPASGDTRVLYYWVQAPYTTDPFETQDWRTLTDDSGRTRTPHDVLPETFPAEHLHYGCLYTADDINTAIGNFESSGASPYGSGSGQICAEPQVEDEHGTFVAGIAAGNGYNASGPTALIGAAPRADIIHVLRGGLVRGLAYDASFEDAIIDGLNFIFSAAGDRPTVVNVSQGTNLGPHNGNTLLDRVCDNLLNEFPARRRSIVFPSGNGNMAYDYNRMPRSGFCRGTIPADDGEVTLGLTPHWLWVGPNFRDVARDRYLDIWYSGPELYVQIACGSDSGELLVEEDDYQGTLQGYTVNIGRDQEQEYRGRLKNIRIFIQGGMAADPWSILLRNEHSSEDAHYYAWTGLTGDMAWLSCEAGESCEDGIFDEMTLSDTACGRSILTVGACLKAVGDEPESIAFYSGAGPTLDGRIKPEIVAVGGGQDAPVTSTASDRASGYSSGWGSSAAAPLVAGAVALIFNEFQDPDLDLNLADEALDQDTIKALLTLDANCDGLRLDPEGDFDQIQLNQYGYGRLRLSKLMCRYQDPLEVDLWIKTADDDFGHPTYPGGCFCASPDIRVYAAGNEVTELTWSTETVDSVYEVRVVVRNLGNDNAGMTTVGLRYTTPHVAPSTWRPALNVAGDPCEEIGTILVPALDKAEVTFEWRLPRAEEVGAPVGERSHYCLLAEVDHDSDRLAYLEEEYAGENISAWDRNIKNNNNVALRNVFIQ